MNEDAMKFATNLLKGALAAGALAAVSTPAFAAPDSKAGAERRSCFYSSQWTSWRSPSKDVIYLKVGVRDVYKVGLSAGSSQLKWPGNYLISQVRGSSSICSAIDLDLAVSDGHFSTPLIAKSLTKLTREEIDAIPAKFRP